MGLVAWNKTYDDDDDDDEFMTYFFLHKSRVSERVVTHSRGLFTLEWTHPATQACLFHTTMVMELS